jgi:hypothetical protein
MMHISDNRVRTSWYRVAERSQDPVYALAVLSLAERWAELMEVRLAAGENIAGIAEETRRAVTPDTDAIAPRTVWGDFIADYFEDCWRYGLAFRRWYGASRRR